MTEIEDFANAIFDDEEARLAVHLATVLKGEKLDSERFLNRIVPLWWEEVEGRRRSLLPEGIYRPLFYITGYGGRADFQRVTRTFMENVSGHFEGAIHQLKLASVGKGGPRSSSGQIARLRKDGIISTELADQMEKFNELANIQSKRFDTRDSARWLDTPTFSVAEVAFAFVLMRKFSIQLFNLIESRGVKLPHGWPKFEQSWLTWLPSINDASR